MKKTLVLLLSILLIAVTFTACDNGNSGPSEPTKEEQATADKLAQEYMNSINYGELIVQAFNGENTSTLTLSEKSKDGFRIEFTDYKGSALQKVADSEIASIASGAIDFKFSKTTATTTSAKATVADYNTYTASTVDEKPLKFMKSDGETAVGGDFAFTISGDAKISFETTNDKISALTIGSEIDINVPDTATLKVGDIEVTYDTIKEDVTVSGGSEVKDPFTAEEAKAALADIINSISKEKLANDIKQGFANVSGKGEYKDIIGVNFEGFKVNYKTHSFDYAEFLKLMESITQGTQQVSSNAEPTEDQLIAADLVKNMSQGNFYDLTFVLTASFGEEGKGYETCFHDNTSKVASFDSGKITVTIYPDVMTEKGIEGIYKLSATSIGVTMADTDKTKYTITVNNLPGPVTMTYPADGSVGITIAGFEASLPHEGDTTSISISFDGESQNVRWSDLTLDDKTGYAEEDAILTDAKYFYTHFGTKGFLNDLYQEFNDGKNKGSNGIEITNQDTIEVTTTEEEAATSSFTMELNLTDYGYWLASSTQRAAGKVSATFHGSISDSESKKIFTATSVDIKSSGAINLTDAADVRHDAKVSLDLKGLKIGTAEGAGIVFNVTTASDESAKNTITGITDYSVENAYDDTKHEIMFDAKNITIELN